MYYFSPLQTGSYLYIDDIHRIITKKSQSASSDIHDNSKPFLIIFMTERILSKS